MCPPAGSIRAEVNDAVVGGIRQRGPDAVGVVLMGVARLVVGVLTLMVLLGACSILGYEVTVLPFSGMTCISGLVSWIATREGAEEERAGQSGGESE
jgi:hypothetical protein